ncbi:hypothetical protein C2845_PM03G30180 [Panicum miliaceum]|uniref:Auxin transport protein BIG n=1 Tax=Panicum miliaceum TaxID=4540 RepID=A0A3L6TAW6_PANMI|nr:hypothetical protein C2845_PM03G30180 [Panicum miliaceum]
MAAAEISAMLNHLAASTERDPPARLLCSPAARPGLEALAGVLSAGPPTDPAAARAVLAAARAVVSAVLPASDISDMGSQGGGFVMEILMHSLEWYGAVDEEYAGEKLGAIGIENKNGEVEQVEPTVVEIVERSLEFCLLHLEKSSYACDDFGLLNEVAFFVEFVLLKGTHNKACSLEPSNINDIIEHWTFVQVEAERLSPQDKYFCYLKGFNCSKSGDDLKRFRLALLPEYLQRDYIISENTQSCCVISPNSMVPLAQHFAVVHLCCIPRLLTLVQKLCQSPALEMVEDVNIDLRLSFTQRILKLVCGLTMEFPPDASDAMMLFSVARCADSLPALFRLKFKFSNHDRVFSVDGVGTILLQILEDFLQLMQIIVCNSDICCTVQVCILSSMLEIFSPNIWKYEKSGSCLVPPLAYSPRVVQFVLKLLKDTKQWTRRVDRDKPDKDAFYYSFNHEINDLSCHVRSEEVPLLKKYTCEEYLQFIFPSGEQWLNGLVHLTFFLHEEGVKSVTNEKPQLSCTKQPVVSELESVASHEEEALFGNLFAEVRPAGITESVEQPTSLGSDPSNSQQGPIQLAADLICFMRTSIFSSEWSRAIYMDACRKFDTCHLDQFLSILKCQACFPDESSTGNTMPSGNKFLHINAACFELLQTFLVCDECPASLREDLVEKVFNVNNGKYTYNHYALALVVHAMTYAANSGSSLGRKIFVQYVTYLLEKVNDTSSSSLNVSDFCASLPCAFHLEILLAAFHLTTESEKADFVKIVLSSLEKMKQPPSGVAVAGLTRWALLLSRLLLVLRHMLLYPLTHPSWLFTRLRSRLRDIQLNQGQLRSMNDYLPSLATVIMEEMLDASVKKSAVTSDLLPQLIDVTPGHAEFYFDKAAAKTLGLNMADLGATMSQILNSWSGMSAEVADDLIVERYTFLICWSTLSVIGCHGNDSILNDHYLKPDLDDVNVFLTFALSISTGASSHAVFGDTGLNRSALKRLSSKTSGSSFGSGSVIPKQLKNSENLVIRTNQVSNPAVDCDASSGEEDEDDGTSDGELGSIDRDEEDDGDSDRALASKVCTFTSSGSNFMEQHWYFCYTCDLTVSKGCCSVCAKVCHRGHRVVYSRSSRFFCDCGAGGVRGSSCQCLKPRKFTGSSTVAPVAASSFHPILAYHEDVEQVADSGSDFEEDISTDADNSMKLSVPNEFSNGLPLLLKNLDIEVRVLEICRKLLPTVLSRRELNLLKDRKVLLGGDVLVSHSSEIFQLKKAFKSGSLDLKIKVDYPNSRELKSHLANGSLAKLLLSISTRGKLAVGEGDKVAIFDVGQIIGQPTASPITADKTNVKPLSRNIVRFEIVHLVFNPLVDHYLAVAGYEDCQVLTLNSRGEVTDRLAIELALQGAYIRRVEWVPGSQVQLIVVTNLFVKIYDLSQDNISPMHYFTVADDIIVDATLVPSAMGKLVLLVLSEGGLLYRLNVTLEGDVGAKVLAETVLVEDAVSIHKGLSLYFSSTYRLLFVSHQDGTTFMGRLNGDSSSITELSYICEEDHDGKSMPAGLYRWRELVAGSGILTCLSKSKSNAPFAVSLGPHELVAQNMRHSTGTNSSVVGVAAYKPLSKDKTHCLILHDDGSLHIYSHTPSGGDNLTILAAEQTKKLGSSILSSRAYTGIKPEFPLDFFEKTTCITSDVKFNSEITKSGDSESIKQRLTSDDGYLESLTSAGFKVTISNPNPDIVMVGCRIHVGNTSASNIPSEITIFHRVIKLDEGMRSWYDIPFTTAESLLADEEFTISFGRTFDGSSTPRIDSIEVYGRAKDEFGWKEKLDAALDMEALGSSSTGGRSGKRPQIAQAAPIQEQVLADALRILSRIYLLCRPSCFTDMVDAGMEVNNLKCRALLETIFQSDREPLLHSAACWVLQAVFPKKDMYYQVKDTMRLLGVIKSLPAITSRIGVGGAASSWVIKEFIAQIHTVSKVALHRKSNLATFLETHGTELVDGLMQVFWGILDLDRPDTQTVNSLVVPCVEFIYSYAECLALHSNEKSGVSVGPAVALLKKLLFAPYEAVQTSSSLAISSRFFQVPFPKQTMIANDDAPENQVKPSAAMSSSSGNAQVMIEEDPAAASVQYCCDGCSTVPILRQRWHCNICPDFDLCETCYEILDADRLPAPHSKDHPMSAIPIELDTFGGEGNEIHFSIDELTDSGVLHAPADRSVQTSPSSVHVFDAIESADFPETITDQTTVSISASKRAINSLLLSHLIEELRGWMGTTAGTRAIPLMQLFYRLSSAVGGPFMDSSKPENLDLEKFVKWLMDEINVNKPFPAKTRCTFGEVSILVFMFFTLMFRNWHQPGSDSSHSRSSGSSDLTEKGPVQVLASTTIALPSAGGDQDKNEFASQLVRACSALRQQSFLNYLMDILQQLVHTFKSSSINGEAGSSGSGCGSLLTIRRELPAGNFSPFFSDSYAKSHPTDLFMDYYKLLLENTFRLVYSMVRPEKEKSAEKDRSHKVPNTKDLKLDGYQDVLCSYISNPHTSFVRRYARRLFLHLCGSKTHYYSVRDSWQYSHEVKKLHKIINKSGGFRNPVPYERSVKLIKCLSILCDVAAARPKNWQKFCLKHMDLLPFLVDNFYHFSEECIIQTLKLLNLALYSGKDGNHNVQKPESADLGSSTRTSSQPSDLKKKRKGDDGSEGSSEKSCMDMEQVVEMFNDKEGDMLKRFIDIFLLEWNSAGVRHEAKCVLFGVWYHAKNPLRETMLTILLQKVIHLPIKYGRFEFHFMAKPSFSFDNMENDDDMRKGLTAIESESENAHRRYQQLMGFKKPLIKLVSSIGEQEIDSQQKDAVQQMMVSLPGPTCKACTPPKSDGGDKESGLGIFSLSVQSKNDDTTGNTTTNNPSAKIQLDISGKVHDGTQRGQDISLLSYSEWESGASYLDFVRRQYKVSQAVKGSIQKTRHDSHKSDYLVLKYGLRWKRRACRKSSKSDFSKFALGSWFILEQLCNLICPVKPEPVYLLILNKAHTQEEFIRGSMTKNPYSSVDVGPLMRDVKNKICNQLDLIGLLEDDYGMELLVGGNIISLDLSISQVYEQVWRKHHGQTQHALSNASSLTAASSGRDCPPMTVTYRLQGLDGEATEPMIKELEEEREESQDPEIEFAIAGAVRECGGLEIILSMIQSLRDDEFRSNQEELASVLNLLKYCCKIRENRCALLRLGALGLLLETARRAFSADAMEPAEGILLIVESLTMEANESDISIAQSVSTTTNEETGQTGFRTSSEWTSGLKLPSIPLILSMLKGLAKGHLPTQKCIDEEGILPLLHALEGVPGENEIGARAENLLDTLANKENNGDGFLGKKIQELRHATRDEMRRRALKKREMLLQGMGMRQEFASDGGRRIVVSQPTIEGLDDVEEEEDGLACMVCREGYTLRPTDMLGVYAFSKRVNLGAASSGSGRGDCVYTTVSHFNIIHYQCHQEAKRADAALKNPKKEWDGATLRNNETLCNCIFPLRGPSVPLGQYTRCVDQYWDQLNSLGRADGSRLRLLTYDIVLHSVTEDAPTRTAHQMAT